MNYGDILHRRITDAETTDEKFAVAAQVREEWQQMNEEIQRLRVSSLEPFGRRLGAAIAMLLHGNTE